MGRAKLDMELIPKEKSRNITFKRRKDGLIRKMQEFSTLCDVSSCIIIYGPRNEKGRIEPEIWPQNLDEINRIIGIYKSKNKDSGYKSSDLSDFFHDRNRKIDDELAKMKRKNLESKFPTWPELLNFKTESELRALGASLSNKFEHVKSRIELLRRNRQLGYNLVNFGLYAPPPPPPPPRFGAVEMNVMYEQAMHHHHELHSVVNQNSMMMSLTNHEGAASASASFKREIFYESSMSEVVDPLLCLNATPLARYYVPAAALPPPPLPSYMHMMPGVAPPLLHFSNHEE